MKPVKKIPPHSLWPAEYPLRSAVVNVVLTYRSGLRTGQRRIGIAPVVVYVGARP